MTVKVEDILKVMQRMKNDEDGSYDFSLVFAEGPVAERYVMSFSRLYDIIFVRSFNSMNMFDTYKWRERDFNPTTTVDGQVFLKADGHSWTPNLYIDPKAVTKVVNPGSYPKTESCVMKAFKELMA